MNYKVSIIIPAYNAESHIARAIEYSIKQTYENIEVVVVNDGSTDRTEEIAKSFQDERVKVISTENGGVSHARNMGIENSTGEYITFVDSDDALTYDAVEYMLRCVLECEADMCICSRYRINSLVQEPYGVATDTDKHIVIEGETPLRYSIVDHPIGYNVTSRLFKREFVGDIRFVEGKNVHEDSYFSFECFLKQPKAVVSGARVYNYYVTPESISRSAFSDKQLSILFFAEKKAERIRELYPQYEDKIPRILIKANISLLQNLCRTNDKAYKKYEKQCIKYIQKNKKVHKMTCCDKKDERFVKIVSCHLYWLYKKCLQWKMKRKK